MIGNQNSEENMLLLGAQKQLYIRAKIWGSIRGYGSIFIAIATPIIFHYMEDAKPIVSISNAIWTLFSILVLKNWQKQTIKQAATVQEEFDVQLFQLPWNNLLVGNKITREIIVDANRSYAGNKEKLKDWYAGIDQYPYPVNILVAQRSNLAWDCRLRRSYGWFLAFATCALLFGGIALSIKGTIMDYLIQFFLPSLSALVIGFENVRGHFEIAEEKHKKEQHVSSLWKDAIANKKTISIEDCRGIQDYIFLNRNRDILVPEFWYNHFQPKYNKDMQEAVKNTSNIT